MLLAMEPQLVRPLRHITRNNAAQQQRVARTLDRALFRGGMLLTKCAAISARGAVNNRSICGD
jgi:hypothetical protein